MLGKIKGAISKISADYCDVRYETNKTTFIEFNGEKIDDITESSVSGFYTRVLDKGGLAGYSFCNSEDLENGLNKAKSMAKINSEISKSNIKFAKVPVVKDKVVLQPKIHPENIPIDEKIKLCQKYNKIALAHKKVENVKTFYREIRKNKTFCNSEGTQIEQETLICMIHGQVIAKDGNHMENTRVAIGGCEDFAKLLEREDLFEKQAKIAVELLSAKQVPSGVHNVLLDPYIIGVFIHEAFGHFSEADLVQDNPDMLKRMQMGEPIATEILTVIDDPTMKGVPGNYVYDDEGVKAKKTYLIKNGTLSGRLHSRETAATMNEEPSGSAITEAYKHRPLIRMSNIFIEPRNNTKEELLSQLGNGLYICGGKGGQTAGDQFSFGAQYGYEVKNGKLGQMIRGINMSGNLFTTLKNISAVGNDLKFNEMGGCGKGQLNWKSGLGGVHTIIKDVTIG